ncbi:MAG: permease-like cell division protein FtsX [Nitrospirae bacterium]|nr:permease-like cell division protein FtsX [Nitrospirota bacterium]
MITASYAFKTALKSLWRDRWINLLSIFVVASSLLIIIFVFFLLYNIDLMTRRLPDRLSMVAYLKNNISPIETQNIINTLKKKADIREVKYISPDEAVVEIKKNLKDAADILSGLDENPLLPSIELRFKSEFTDPDVLRRISEEIRKIEGVDSIYYGEKTAEAIAFVRKTVWQISLFAVFAVSAAVVFVNYGIVNVLFYRKKDEIEILSLLGATGCFIRTPFLIEGGFIGFTGGFAAAAGALAVYFGSLNRLNHVIPILKSLTFPVESLCALPVIGAVLGILGSVIAVRRLDL